MGTREKRLCVSICNWILFWKITIWKTYFFLLHFPIYDLFPSLLRHGESSIVITGMHRERINSQLIFLKLNFTIKQQPWKQGTDERNGYAKSLLASIQNIAINQSGNQQLPTKPLLVWVHKNVLFSRNLQERNMSQKRISVGIDKCYEKDKTE